MLFFSSYICRMEKTNILREISTHKAVVNKDKIDIILKGLPQGIFKGGADEVELKATYPKWFKNEVLYSIPLADADDLFYIFENLEETNRINFYEGNRC